MLFINQIRFFVCHFSLVLFVDHWRNSLKQLIQYLYLRNFLLLWSKILNEFLFIWLFYLILVLWRNRANDWSLEFLRIMQSIYYHFHLLRRLFNVVCLCYWFIQLLSNIRTCRSFLVISIESLKKILKCGFWFLSFACFITHEGLNLCSARQRNTELRLPSILNLVLILVKFSILTAGKRPILDLYLVKRYTVLRLFLVSIQLIPLFNLLRRVASLSRLFRSDR